MVITTFLIWFAIGYLFVGVIAAILIYRADIHWVNKSVQPPEYRTTLEDIEKMRWYYLVFVIFYPLFLYDEWNTVREFIKDILSANDKIIEPDHDNEFVKLNKPEEKHDD